TAFCTTMVAVIDRGKPTISCFEPIQIGACTGAVAVPYPNANDNCGGFEYALDLDGVDDIAKTTNITSELFVTTGYTFEIWFKADTLDPVGGNVLFGTDDPAAKFWFGVSNNVLYFRHFGDTIMGSTPIQTGVWHHAAVSMDQGCVCTFLYLDGNNEDVLSGGIPFGTDPVITIGANNGNQFFDGQVDEVRIWDRLRQDTEIQATMNQAHPTNNGLAFYYNFNHGPQSHLVDEILRDIRAPCGFNATNAIVWPGALANNNILSNDVAGLERPTGPFSQGTNLIVWTAIDPFNNQSSCTQVVVLADTIPPTIMVTDMVTVISGTPSGDVCEATVSIDPPIVTDSCDPSPAYSNDYNNLMNASDTYPPGTTDVTWTAIDASGNMTQVVTRVIVLDRGKPTLFCPDPINRGTISGCDAFPPIPFAYATDNCGPFDYALELDGLDDVVKGTNVTSELNITTSYTMEVWFKADRFNPSGHTIFSTDDPQEDFRVCVTNESGNDVLFWQHKAISDLGTTPLTPGRWYHVALVYDQPAGAIFLYLNGNLENV
ncbi:MAG: LamG-like jellyroll fold domain-containing protein, partial [Verrucomicrobiota bacterium]